MSEAAARWPAADRPPMTVSTGIRCPTRRAVRANLRGLPNDSTYSTASLVTPSCSHHISMSLLETSYLSPTEANDETPMPEPGQVLEQRDAHAAGLHHQARAAGAAGCGGGEGRVQARRAGTATPKQFGPTSRMPYLRQMASRSAPSAPRPEVITTSALHAPLAARGCHLGPPPAGTAMTARSTGSGRSATDGEAGQPLHPTWRAG